MTGGLSAPQSSGDLAAPGLEAGQEEAMKKPAAAPNDPVADPDFVAPADLRFDLENPRFIDQHFKDELEIIQYLYDNADVDELIQSILSAGYIDFEPLIVQRNSNIVFEGNRRLAGVY
jgi:hypothetical protein